MTEPTTIAHEWQDYAAACCQGVPADQLLQARVSFYAGWHACVQSSAVLHMTQVTRWRAEFNAFTGEYAGAYAEHLKPQGPAP